MYYFKQSHQSLVLGIMLGYFKAIIIDKHLSLRSHYNNFLKIGHYKPFFLYKVPIKTCFETVIFVFLGGYDNMLY